ncbi:hypothetical protein BN341_1170 [Helicobacter heilmannii ASB1.4]|uniref:Uncharacterized protein n=1 Tax=Helicobacter heilmannii TaxID=35817 RepID=A0A0K2Y8A8_HELHE|nr:hypothetical protein BN341_1170 [Helicobacter heilmannii ASB1.4]CRI33924.1 hypothetical protein HHE01_16100 [Helicobacter heilmannii]
MCLLLLDETKSKGIVAQFSKWKGVGVLDWFVFVKYLKQGLLNV